MSLLSAVAGSETVDSVVGTTKAAAALPFGQICAYCKKRNHFAAKDPAKSKVSTIQERFYLSAAGVGSKGRKMVTLTVSKESKPLSGHDVSFLMDVGAECNLLPLDVYKKVTGDLHLNFLKVRGKSVLILGLWR